MYREKDHDEENGGVVKQFTRYVQIVRTRFNKLLIHFIIGEDMVPKQENEAQETSKENDRRW